MLVEFKFQFFLKRKACAVTVRQIEIDKITWLVSELKILFKEEKEK